LRTQVGDAGLEAFKDCRNLKNLALTFVDVTDDGLAHFKDLENSWVHLNLHGLIGLTDTGLGYFKNQQQLTSLNLDGLRKDGFGDSLTAFIWVGATLLFWVITLRRIVSRRREWRVPDGAGGKQSGGNAQSK
jgi:hypothetical protein